MNPQLSISQLKRKYGRFRLLTLLLSVLVATMYGGFWLGQWSQSQQQLLDKFQRQRLDELYFQNDQQRQQIHFLKVEMEVEKQASAYVREQLQSLHQENFKLQKDLAFYQKIMAPELEADGVEIDQFDIIPSRVQRIFHFKLVLVQTQKRKRYAKGHVEITIIGSQANKGKSYSVAALTDDFKPEALTFSFQYFKIIEGDFLLPEGFVPQRVNVVAVLPGTKWQKHSKLERQFSFYPEQAF